MPAPAASLVQALPSRFERRVAWVPALDLCHHSWRFALTVSLAAGVAVAIGHGVTEEPTTSHLVRQLAAGGLIAAIEATAAMIGFVLLGRYLGLRSDTGAAAPEP